MTTIAISASGAQTAVIGTEQTLGTDVTGGVYILAVDTSAMLAGDVLELRVYTKVLSSGSSLVCWKNASGPSPPAIPIVLSPPTPSNQSLSVSLKQVAGTARTFPWKLMRL